MAKVSLSFSLDLSLSLSLSLSVCVCVCVCERCKNIKSSVKARWIELKKYNLGPFQLIHGDV